MESERYYPFEHKNEKKTEASAPVNSETPSSAVGKGRRGGNAAASIVVHSGKTSERAEGYARRHSEEYMASGERGNYGRDNGGDYRRERKDDFHREHGDDYHHERRDDYRRDRRDGGYGERKDDYRRDRRDGGYGERKDDYRRDRRDGGYGDRKDDFRGRRNSDENVGKTLTLRVIENTEYGSFLSLTDDKKVLLPFAEMTERPAVGDEVRVTLYEDKGNRITATMRTPFLKKGETGVLSVAAVTKIGIFVDNGMPKQVLVPFRELLHTPEVGDEVLVYLYDDKSGREAGTMRVYRHLQRESGYAEGDHVEGFVYEINDDLGVFVAVDNRYYGLIPKSEYFGNLKYGDRVEARVSKVRSDGKMDLLMREKLHTTANRDANLILEEMKRQGGKLPYADRADAEVIKDTFSMSKNQFKRALGYLYKKRFIEIDRDTDTVKLIIQFKGSEQ